MAKETEKTNTLNEQFEKISRSMVVIWAYANNSITKRMEHLTMAMDKEGMQWNGKAK